MEVSVVAFILMFVALLFLAIGWFLPVIWQNAPASKIPNFKTEKEDREEKDVVRLVSYGVILVGAIGFLVATFFTAWHCRFVVPPDAVGMIARGQGKSSELLEPDTYWIAPWQKGYIILSRPWDGTVTYEDLGNSHWSMKVKYTVKRESTDQTALELFKEWGDQGKIESMVESLITKAMARTCDQMPDRKGHEAAEVQRRLNLHIRTEAAESFKNTKLQLVEVAVVSVYARY